MQDGKNSLASVRSVQIDATRCVKTVLLETQGLAEVHADAEMTQ